MTQKLIITRQDLKGKYSNVTNCPIAKAAKRYFNDKNIIVGSDFIFTTNEVYRFKIEDSHKALKRARTFWGKIIGGFTMKITKA